MEVFMPARRLVLCTLILGLALPLSAGAARAFGAPDDSPPSAQVAQNSGKASDKANDKANKAKGNKGAADDKAAEKASQEIIDTLISASERAIIGEYVHTAKSSGQGLPPGLAQREQLPPGLQKQIQRNGTLPPGLAKRELPPDLLSRLPRRPEGQGYRVVGDDVVLIDTATRVILDVVKGVLAD
jgi:hypothetical protein